MTAPPSDPGDPIEAGVFKTSNQAEDIALVSNQVLDVDDDMEPDPYNILSVENPATNTLIKVQTWGWDGINRRAVIAQNHNGPSFKNGCTPQILA